MTVRLLTLDCANTLLRGAWNPSRFAIDAAREAGLCLPRRAASEYDKIARRHLEDVLRANRAGSTERVHEAYVRLVAEWLTGLDVDPALADAVVRTGESLLLSTRTFEPFPDALPFLVEARRRGIRTAVVSNWDASLPAVLRAHGLAEWTDQVYASLVFGAEKPDPAMLLDAMRSIGATAAETLHIGDDPIDDLGAAETAGVRGLLLDRCSPPSEGRIAGLMEAFEWID